MDQLPRTPIHNRNRPAVNGVTSPSHSANQPSTRGGKLRPDTRLDAKPRVGRNRILMIRRGAVLIDRPIEMIDGLSIRLPTTTFSLRHGL